MEPPVKRPRDKCSNVCAVKHCGVTSQTSGARLFRFPKEAERCNEWVKLCGCEYLLKFVRCLNTSMYRVCHRHFEEKMFLISVLEKNSRLVRDSMPTLNLPVTIAAEGDQTYLRAVRAISTIIADEPGPSGLTTKPSVSTCVDHTYTMAFDASQQAHEPGLLQLTAGSLMCPLAEENIPVVTTSTAHDCEQPILIEIPHTSEPSLKSPEVGVQTPKQLTGHTPRKAKLRRKVHALKTQVAGYKKRLQLKDASTSVVEGATLQDFKALCDKFLTPKCANFVKIQADLTDKTPHQRRYTREFLQVCLQIYFMGPKAYRNISNIFTLPTHRTLNRLTEAIYFKPGFNDSIFDALKEKVATFDEMDKNCCLLLDEMSLKSHLFYVIGKDTVVGLEDLGDGKSFRPTLNVLALMIKGISTNWKQPLAYFFVHNTCSPTNLKGIIEAAITKLKTIGLKVRVVVNDMGSNNIGTSNMLNITEENQVFTVDGEEIVYLFDVPHIIKAIRNNLLKNQFRHDDKVTSWKHISTFYEADKKLSNRLAPKLTDAHINPSNMEKMRVSLAAQVLSATVAAGMTTYVALNQLPAEAASTISFIEAFDKLFDILNSSRTSGAKEFNRAFKGLEYQTQFLNDMLRFLDRVKVFNNKGEDVTKKIKSIRCLKITIKGLFVLWDKLKLVGFQYLFTRRLCQDSLENYFGSIRQQSGNAVNPTPIQFQRSFKKLFTQDFFNSTHQNCVPDFDQILQLNMQNLQRYEEESDVDDPITVNLSLKDCDYRFHVIEKNSIRYICGYLLKKCLGIHTCDTCTKYANEHKDLDETSLYAHFRRYQTQNLELFGKLYMPNNNFFNYICELEQLFEQNFEKLVLLENVLATFTVIYNSSSLLHPCEHFPYVYLVKLYGRMRLFYCLKFINSNFKFTNVKGERTHRKKLIWQHA